MMPSFSLCMVSHCAGFLTRNGFYVSGQWPHWLRFSVSGLKGVVDFSQRSGNIPCSTISSVKTCFLGFCGKWSELFHWSLAVCLKIRVDKIL